MSHGNEYNHEAIWYMAVNEIKWQRAELRKDKSEQETTLPELLEFHIGCGSPESNLASKIFDYIDNKVAWDSTVTARSFIPSEYWHLMHDYDRIDVGGICYQDEPTERTRVARVRSTLTSSRSMLSLSKKIYA